MKGAHPPLGRAVLKAHGFFLQFLPHDFSPIGSASLSFAPDEAGFRDIEVADMTAVGDIELKPVVFYVQRDTQVFYRDFRCHYLPRFV